MDGSAQGKGSTRCLGRDEADGGQGRASCERNGRGEWRYFSVRLRTVVLAGTWGWAQRDYVVAPHLLVAQPHLQKPLGLALLQQITYPALP